MKMKVSWKIYWGKEKTACKNTEKIRKFDEITREEKLLASAHLLKT